jgi:hypothetical protein
MFLEKNETTTKKIMRGEIYQEEPEETANMIINTRTENIKIFI